MRGIVFWLARRDMGRRRVGRRDTRLRLSSRGRWRVFLLLRFVASFSGGRLSRRRLRVRILGFGYSAVNAGAKRQDQKRATEPT
jgi:hypothetical protein